MNPIARERVKKHIAAGGCSGKDGVANTARLFQISKDQVRALAASLNKGSDRKKEALAKFEDIKPHIVKLIKETIREMK